MVKAHAVFLGDVYLKCFLTQSEADILCVGLRIWLANHDMDTDIVRIKEEVMN